MESKTTRNLALIAFGVAMFVLGRVTDCPCSKQVNWKCDKSGASIDIHALVGEEFEGDTVIIMDDKEGRFSKEIRIEKYIEIGEDDHDSEDKH